MLEPHKIVLELKHFLYIMALAWGVVSQEHAIFGFAFSYEKLLLFMIGAAILCFAVRKCFFDD